VGIYPSLFQALLGCVGNYLDPPEPRCSVAGKTLNGWPPALRDQIFGTSSVLTDARNVAVRLSLKPQWRAIGEYLRSLSIHHVFDPDKLDCHVAW
jgi:hypothetical protein